MRFVSVLGSHPHLNGTDSPRCLGYPTVQPLFLQVWFCGFCRESKFRKRTTENPINPLPSERPVALVDCLSLNCRGEVGGLRGKPSYAVPASLKRTTSGLPPWTSMAGRWFISFSGCLPIFWWRFFWNGSGSVWCSFFSFIPGWNCHNTWCAWFGLWKFHPTIQEESMESKRFILICPPATDHPN